MTWVEVFTVFLVAHLVGDFALQTHWQAQRKRGGLSRDRTARTALLAHVCTYTLAFVPALIWLWDDTGALAIAVIAVVFAAHLIQDDGRLLDSYIRAVKHADPQRHPVVRLAVDQTIHVVVLFGLALVAVA